MYVLLQYRPTYVTLHSKTRNERGMLRVKLISVVRFIYYIIISNFFSVNFNTHPTTLSIPHTLRQRLSPALVD